MLNICIGRCLVPDPYRQLHQYSKFLINRLLGPRKKEDELSRKMRYQETADCSVFEISLAKFV